MLAKRTLSTFAIALAVAGAVHADENQLFGQEAGWNVFKSDALRGCLMEQTQDSGLQVQFGLNGKRELGYVALFAGADLGVDDGATQITSLSIDKNLFEGESEQQASGDFQGGFMYFNNLNFLDDIINGQEMVIQTQAGQDVTIDLTGTKVATDLEVLADVVLVDGARGLADPDRMAVDVKFVLVVRRDLNSGFRGHAKIDWFAEKTLLADANRLLGGRAVGPNPLRLIGCRRCGDHQPTQQDTLKRGDTNESPRESGATCRQKPCAVLCQRAFHGEIIL